VIDFTQAQDEWKKLTSSVYNFTSTISAHVPAAITPDVAAIPLELQTELYGPWYIATSIGKTEVEHDEGLVPWNYGSYQLMNLAGQAKVSEMGIRMQRLEYGAVEFPDIPSLQLGDQLLSSGPYVTDISVSVAVQGVTTRYSLRSWSPKFGKLAKFYADKFFKIKKAQYEFVRRMKEISRKILK